MGCIPCSNTHGPHHDTPFRYKLCQCRAGGGFETAKSFSESDQIKIPHIVDMINLTTTVESRSFFLIFCQFASHDTPITSTFHQLLNPKSQSISTPKAWKKDPKRARPRPSDEGFWPRDDHKVCPHRIESMKSSPDIDDLKLMTSYQ